MTETGYVGIDVHRASRIGSAAHGGQILLSQTTYELVAPDLPAEIGFRGLGAHRFKDLTRAQSIYQAVVAGLPTEFPPLKSLDSFPNNLPRQLASFVGREAEMAEVKRLLSTTNLLTLTGTGGAGKTRLAIQVAADLLEQYSDGVWLVELAALAHSSLIPETVATALGLHEQPGRSVLTSLRDYLQPKALLLVLDNCEHLVAACAQLAEALLQVCPNLRILATSREPLGIRGELTWRIPSLSFPDPRRLPLEESLLRYDAIRLFYERAIAARPGFALEDHEEAVALICQKLDGIPLAVELAAPRVRSLSVEQIAAKLDDRFRLLTGGSRVALPRHQTLRAALDWSYDLLSVHEQNLLRRLSAFAGGFTLESAEEVCAGEGISEADIVQLLTQLVDKSMVHMEELGNTVRYRLLETVRQYGLDRLLASGDSRVWPRRHRNWYLGLAERAEPGLQGPDQRIWLDRLETEHDNLRAALRWSEESREPHVALQLAAALGRFWTVRGHLSEGRQFLESALASERGAPALRAKAFNAAGGLAHDQGDYEMARRSYERSLAIRRELGDRKDIARSLSSLASLARVQGEYARAVALHEESLALFRQLEDKAGIASAQNSLGIVARYQGNYERAVALHQESLAINRELGDMVGIAFSLNGLGNVARDRGDYSNARSFLEESLAIRRELGERQGIAASLNNLGVVVQYQGDYERATTLYEESLAIKRELGDKKGVANSLGNLGNVAYDRGDYAQATVRYRESLALCKEMGDKVGIAETLINLGNVVQYQGDYMQAVALYRESLVLLREMKDQSTIAAGVEGLARAQCGLGRPEHAATLFGAAEGLREAIGAPVPLVKRAEHEDNVAVVRTQLDPMTFAGAWAVGRAMTLEQTLESALAEERQ